MCKVLTKQQIVEGVTEVTSVGSVMGSPTDSNGGYFIGPLSGVNKKKLNSRIMYPKKGKQRLVQPPQGYMNENENEKSVEFVYSVDGNKVTTKDLYEWFDVELNKQKPSFNGGKLVQIEPKCQAFPYCSQGAADQPIKLVGENKDGMCPDCYEFISEVAKLSNKTPEYITEIIRKEYLSYKYD